MRGEKDAGTSSALSRTGTPRMHGKRKIRSYELIHDSGTPPYALGEDYDDSVKFLDDKATDTDAHSKAPLSM